MNSEDRPTRQAEYAHYLTHENDPSDAGYRRFLKRLADPLVCELAVGMSGLDYGSGPGPTLSKILEEQGFVMTVYDPFFAADAAALGRTYDFITCTETVEHFHDPAGEFERFDRLLRPGGILAIMTQMLESPGQFAEWWYPRDPTHVCFYQQRTMEWIGRRFGWELTVPVANVGFFGKPLINSSY